MYSLPQEIEVWYIIPSIRKEFSKVLVKKHKLTLEKAGNILGVSKAAVSQYLKKKRARLVKIPSNIRKEIEISADKLVKNEDKALEEIENLLTIEPNFYEAIELKGIIYSKKKEHDKAFNFLELVAHRNSENYLYQYNLALINLKLKRYGEGLKVSNRSIKLNGKFKESKKLKTYIHDIISNNGEKGFDGKFSYAHPVWLFLFGYL